MLETIVRDLSYGLRQLRHDRSFSLIAVFTLALGAGLSTALFSVIDAALLRPLPYASPEQLVRLFVEETNPGGTPSRYGPSMSDIRKWRTLTTVVGHAGMGRVSGFVPLIVDTTAPRRLTVAEASEGFLETYGVAPILGRAIHSDDTQHGAPSVALLGHAFWQQEFGGDPTVLGRTLRIQNQPVTIEGVLPRGFYSGTDVWQANWRTWWRCHLPWVLIDLGIASKASDCEIVGGSDRWFNRDGQTSGCYHFQVERPGQLWRRTGSTTSAD